MSEPKGVAPSPKLGGRPGETVGDCRSVDDWRDQDPGVSHDDIRESRRFDLIAHLHAQKVWSLQTFGPGRARRACRFSSSSGASGRPRSCPSTRATGGTG